MSLYLKYRPATLEEFYGNNTIKVNLRGMFKKNDIPHAILFHGPTGCGKTTLARIVANKLECSENNIIEIDTAQFRGIDTVRDLRKNIQYNPLDGGVRVYILDETHSLTTDAMNSLLKILEDTPAHVYFILCTTDPQKLLPTIKGRCSQFQVNVLDDDEMAELLTTTAEKEGDTVTTEIIAQITQDSQGHPRNALQILEQVLATPVKRRLAIAQQAAIEQSESIALCRALMKGEPWSKVKVILQGLKTQDPEGIRRVVMGYAQSVLLSSDNERAALILEEFLEPTYNAGFPRIVYASYSVTKN